MILVTYVLVKPGEDAMVSSPDQYCPLPSHIIVLYLTLFWFLSVRLIVQRCIFFSSRGREQPPHCVALFRLKFSLVCWTASSLSCSTNQLHYQSAARPISCSTNQPQGGAIELFQGDAEKCIPSEVCIWSER